MFIAGPVYSIIQFKLILCCIIYIYIVVCQRLKMEIFFILI